MTEEMLARHRSRSWMVCRWIQTFTAEVIDAARPDRHSIGVRWVIDETYVKVADRRIYLDWVIDRQVQTIDVLRPTRRDGVAVQASFTDALGHAAAPVEATDRGLVYPRDIDELIPGSWHVLRQNVPNPIGRHGRLNARLRSRAA